MRPPAVEVVRVFSPKAEGAVRFKVDRGSRLGNPYREGEHGNRAEVVRLYREHLERALAEQMLGLAHMKYGELEAQVAVAQARARAQERAGPIITPSASARQAIEKAKR